MTAPTDAQARRRQRRLARKQRLARERERAQQREHAGLTRLEDAFAAVSTEALVDDGLAALHRENRRVKHPVSDKERRRVYRLKNRFLAALCASGRVDSVERLIEPGNLGHFTSVAYIIQTGGYRFHQPVWAASDVMRQMATDKTLDHSVRQEPREIPPGNRERNLRTIEAATLRLEANEVQAEGTLHLGGHGRSPCALPPEPAA